MDGEAFDPVGVGRLEHDGVRTSGIVENTRFSGFVK